MTSGRALGILPLKYPTSTRFVILSPAKGGKIVRQPGPMKHGTTVIAFVEDPDGYKIELIERRSL